MAHGGIRDTLKLVNCFHHLLQKLGWCLVAFEQRLCLHGGLQLGPRDLQVERVHTMPLLGRDLFTHMAGVLARRYDARQHGCIDVGIECERARQLIRIAAPLDALGLAKRLQHTLPSSLRAHRVFV